MIDYYDTLLEILDALDIEYSERPGYSGRGMYGTTVSAVVCNYTKEELYSELDTYFNELEEIEGEEPIAEQVNNWYGIIAKLRIDNMGLSYVLY